MLQFIPENNKKVNAWSARVYVHERASVWEFACVESLKWSLQGVVYNFIICYWFGRVGDDFAAHNKRLISLDRCFCGVRHLLCTCWLTSTFYFPCFPNNAFSGPKRARRKAKVFYFCERKFHQHSCECFHCNIALFFTKSLGTPSFSVRILRLFIL